MPAPTVVELYDLISAHGITAWVDGGWGVDALLCGQTRPHGDLDIAVQVADLPRLRELLTARGYHDQPRDDACAWNFVLADGAGHELDVHAIELDAAGNGIYGPAANGQQYPASALAGRGRILGREVRCIAVEDLLRFHSGYELDETDYRDVAALCAKFSLPLPAEYRRFTEQA